MDDPRHVDAEPGVSRSEFNNAIRLILNLQSRIASLYDRFIPLRRDAPPAQAGGGGGYSGPFRVGLGTSPKTLSILAGTVWPHMNDAIPFLAYNNYPIVETDENKLFGLFLVCTATSADLAVYESGAAVNKTMGVQEILLATFNVAPTTLEPINISQKQYGDIHLGMVDMLEAGLPRQPLVMNAAGDNLEIEWFYYV